MVFTDIFDVLFYVVSKYKKGKKICTSLETKPDEEVILVFNRQVRKTGNTDKVPDFISI